MTTQTSFTNNNILLAPDMSNNAKAPTTTPVSMETNDGEGDDLDMDFIKVAEFIEATIDAKIWAEALLRQEAKTKTKADDYLVHKKDSISPPNPATPQPQHQQHP